MTDKWFLEDINKSIAKRNRIVILDPNGRAGFLVDLLKKDNYTVLETQPNIHETWESVREELFLRYEAEKQYKDSNVVFYAQRQEDKLSFLYDYCFTHGCLDLSNLEAWLKQKIFKATQLQVNIPTEKLLSYAKLGMGKDLNWWQKVIQELEDLVHLSDELLPFLHQPDQYFASKDEDLRTLFANKFFELIGQPFAQKPAATLAKEVAHYIFDRLLHNDIDADLLAIYHKWIDSNTFSECLDQYLLSYKIDTTVDIWQVHPAHCFKKIDIQQLEALTKQFRNKTALSQKINLIQKRAKQAQAPSWWSAILELLTYNSQSLARCNTFEKVMDYYTSQFYQVDRAIRNIYATFLHEQDIVRPLQEYYETLNRELLQHWLDTAHAYQTNQQGKLAELIQQTHRKIAIIVGDGVRYEIAAHIAQTLSKTYNVERHTMLADMPSETEHNMSALYVGNNEVIKIHKEREKRLSAMVNRPVDFVYLEDIHHNIQSDCLVLTYKDIDSAGEKLQQGAIKLFSEFEKVLVNKIGILIKMGYEVHLVTDHGFVLTGILDEADKIDTTTDGKKEVHERFIRTVVPQAQQDWLRFDRKYGVFNYVYAAKSDKPFKSRGVYGFSHGGFTPQEIIIPHFIFKKAKSDTDHLEVVIANKSDLREVTGNIFEVKIKAEVSASDLFSASRKVEIILYSGKKELSRSNIITVEATQEQSVEFSFRGKSELQCIVIDANTQEQIDRTTVKKSNARDLGGLF